MAGRPAAHTDFSLLSSKRQEGATAPARKYHFSFSSRTGFFLNECYETSTPLPLSHPIRPMYCILTYLSKLSLSSSLTSTWWTRWMSGSKTSRSCRRPPDRLSNSIHRRSCEHPSSSAHRRSCEHPSSSAHRRSREHPSSSAHRRSRERPSSST